LLVGGDIGIPAEDGGEIGISLIVGADMGISFVLGGTIVMPPAAMPSPCSGPISRRGADISRPGIGDAPGT
jgi:hypothetical protein